MKKIATLVLVISFLGLSTQSQAHESQAHERNHIVPALIGAAIITSVIANSQPHYVQPQPQRYEYGYGYQYPNQVYYAPTVPQTYYVPQPVYQPNPVVIYSSPPVYVNRDYHHEHNYRNYNHNEYNPWNNHYRH